MSKQRIYEPFYISNVMYYWNLIIKLIKNRAKLLHDLTKRQWQQEIWYCQSGLCNYQCKIRKVKDFHKRRNFPYKITGYLQNIYQLLYSLAFLLVKTTKIYIHIKKGMNELMILTL